MRRHVAGALLAGAAGLAAPAADANSDDGPRRWDVSVGAVASFAPEYAGAGSSSVRVLPGFGLRWGRVSFASRSAFAARSGEGSARGGLRIELAQGARWRTSLGLRQDSGRSEGDSEALRGLGDVRSTLRLRVAATWRFDEGWRAGAAVAVDALGRDGGTLFDLSAGRDLRLTDRTTAGIGVATTLGDRRYLQTRYGINAQQAVRSGYPVYEPGAGSLDVSLSAGARTTFTPQWALFYGASVSRLLDPAAASPLVQRRTSVGFNCGLVYRF
jgi:MipA family protein